MREGEREAVAGKAARQGVSTTAANGPVTVGTRFGLIGTTRQSLWRFVREEGKPARWSPPVLIRRVARDARPVKRQGDAVTGRGTRQKGFTTARKTMTITAMAGISFMIRQNFSVRGRSPFANFFCAPA